MSDSYTPLGPIFVGGLGTVLFGYFIATGEYPLAVATLVILAALSIATAVVVVAANYRPDVWEVADGGD